MALDGIEDRQAAAAGPDHKTQVAVELDDAASDAARVDGIDAGAAPLEVGRRAALARLVFVDAELGQQLLVPVARLLFHIEVAVERDEGAILGLRERVDLGQRQAVLEEGPR